jgi:hypothetical protein
MQQNDAMPSEVLHDTPIRVFAAMTRAVRDEPMAAAVREQAFELLTRLADQVFEPAFAPTAEALLALVARDAQLGAALGPHVKALRAMAQAYDTGSEPGPLGGPRPDTDDTPSATSARA